VISRRDVPASREFSGNEKKSVKVKNSRGVSLRDEFHERAGAV